MQTNSKYGGRSMDQMFMDTMANQEAKIIAWTRAK